MSRKERLRQDTGANGTEKRLLERISGIRDANARKLMEGDEYRIAKEREADECRGCARKFLQKKPEMASEMLERAADVYTILGEMEPDQFRQKENFLTACRLYDEAGWLVAEKDAGKAAKLLAKSGDALAYMEGKCDTCPELRGMLQWKNSARVKYSNALRLLERGIERLSKSSSVTDRARGAELGRQAEELRERMDACGLHRGSGEGTGLLDAAV